MGTHLDSLVTNLVREVFDAGEATTALVQLVDHDPNHTRAVCVLLHTRAGLCTQRDVIVTIVDEQEGDKMHLNTIYTIDFFSRVERVSPYLCRVP